MTKPRTRKAENCFQCNAILNGRADQVYCSKSCQNAHFKEVKEQFVYLSGIISKGETRNCVVAEGILGRDLKKVEISKRTLFKHNFDLFSFEKIIWTKSKRKFKVGHFLFWIRKNGNVVIQRIKKTIVESTRVYRRWEGEFLWRIGQFGSLVERKDIDYDCEGLTVIPFICSISERNRSLFSSKYLST
ncbi:MAG: hypothetical protein ACPGU5_02760 [Lishizhenia sp.]